MGESWPAWLLPALCFGVAAAAWVVAAIAAVAMLRHREPGRSRFWYATHGLAFFTGEGFTAGAQPHRRRFRLAAMAFFAAVLLGALGAVFLATLRPAG